MVDSRASMLDDEKYPIPVSLEESPAQLSSLPEVNYDTTFSTYATPIGSTSPVSSMSRNPLVVSTTMHENNFTAFKDQQAWRTPVFDSELLKAPSEHSSSIRKPNVWMVLFLTLAALVTGALIAAVVLGGGGRKMQPLKGASPAMPTSTFAVQVTPTPTSAPIAEVSAAAATANTTAPSTGCSGLFLRDGKTWNMQVYYQLANTTQIIYRMNLNSGEPGNETFAAVRTMSLAVPPKSGSPIGATASTDLTGVVYLDVFYITLDNNIAQAHLACPISSADCKTVSNEVISEGAQTLHPSSSLAAVNVNEAQDWRIYYQNTNRNIVELVGNSSGFNKGTEIYSGSTLSGSSLTAVNIDRSINNINVFFVDNDSKALYYTQFISSWQSATPVTTAVVTSWNPTSNLASVYASTPDQMRVYYVGIDSKVWEYIGYNASTTHTTWEIQPGTAKQWLASTTSTQDITAIAFDDQVRWWQYGSTSLLEAALDNTTWVERSLN